MRIEQQRGRMLRWRVLHENRVLACVNPGSDDVSFRLFLPCVRPLYTPSGLPVTEMGAHNYPHHKGVWIGHGDANGIDFFTEHPVRLDLPLGMIATVDSLLSASGDRAGIVTDLE